MMGETNMKLKGKKVVGVLSKAVSGVSGEASNRGQNNRKSF